MSDAVSDAILEIAWPTNTAALFNPDWMRAVVEFKIAFSQAEWLPPPSPAESIWYYDPPKIYGTTRTYGLQITPPVVSGGPVLKSAYDPWWTNTQFTPETAKREMSRELPPNRLPRSQRKKGGP